MRKHVGRGLLGWWVLATVVGWVMGIIGSTLLSYLVVNLVYPKETQLIVGLCIGVAVGASQRAAAREWVPLTQAWLWGAVVAIGPPFIAAGWFDAMGIGAGTSAALWGTGLIAVAGAAIGGSIQMRQLRPHSRRARLWVPASVVAWGLAWGSMSGPAGIVVGGLVLGVVGGAMLIWLLRSPPAA